MNRKNSRNKRVPSTLRAKLSQLSLDENTETSIEALAHEYASRPKPSLDTLPLEILLEIACYLPNVQSAVRLGCTCKTLHQSLGGSQYFWFQWGNKRLKKFQKFSKTYDYRQYILTVISGGIKSTCQMCLKPKKGLIRRPMCKILCTECLDENVICDTSVEKIPGLDLSKIETVFRKYTWDDLQRPGGQGNSGVEYYWLPSVKHQLEAKHQLPWKDIVSTFLPELRPLESPAVNRKYRVEIVTNVEATFMKFYEDHYEDTLAFFITKDQFQDLVRQCHGILVNMASMVWAPAEGQSDDFNTTNIEAMLNYLKSTILGVEASSLALTLIWPPVFRAHTARVGAGGQVWGHCGICYPVVRRSQSKGMRRDALALSDLVIHVSLSHPDRILKTDWSWGRNVSK